MGGSIAEGFPPVARCSGHRDPPSHPSTPVPLVPFRPFLLILSISGLLLGGCTVEEDPCGQFTGAEANLDSIHEVVFANSCAFSSCHGGGAPQADLDLSTPDAAYASLIDMPSLTGSSGKILVSPGQPDSSYLLDKLKGIGIESNESFPDATPMPPSQGGLCEPSITAISDWIAQGAPR